MKGTACIVCLALLACGARTPIDEGDAGSSSGGSSGGSGSGGSSGGSSGGAPGSYCVLTVAGMQTCIGYQGGGPPESIAAVCQQESGTLVDACPSSGQLGCCTFMTTELQASVCYYCGVASASVFEQACTGQGAGGTWTPGPGCGG